MKNHKIVRKIYRNSEINRINKKITMLNNYPIDEVTFLNIRLLTTIIIFFITLFIFKTGTSLFRITIITAITNRYSITIFPPFS